MAITPIPEQKTIGPSITYVIGISLTLVVLAVSGTIGADIFLYFSGLPKDYGYIGFWLVGTPTIFWFFAEGNKGLVPIGFAGVPTFLGKRVDHILGLKHIFGLLLVLSEGSHFIPILTGFIEVDHRIQPSNEIEVTQLSSDGILMTGKLTYRYRVTKPFVYLDARKELNSLDDVARSTLRDAIAAIDSAVASSGDIKSHLAEVIATEMIVISEAEYGVGIIKVMVSSILPPPEYEAALSLKRIREAEREAEKVILTSFTERLNELKAQGLSPERAAEIIQNERKTATSEFKTFRIEGAETSARILADALKAVFGKVTT